MSRLRKRSVTARTAYVKVARDEPWVIQGDRYEVLGDDVRKRACRKR